MAIGYMARVTWNPISGLAEDAAVMDFTYRWLGAGSPTNNDFSDLRIAIGNFFALGDGVGQTLELAAYFSGELVRTSTALMIEMYAIPDTVGTLGSPVYFGNYGPLPAAAAGQHNMPGEVALALSINADLSGVLEEVGTTRPRARRRGRTYLGPFNTAGQPTSSTSPSRPPAQLRSDVLAAATAHLDNEAAAESWGPGIWSRKDWAVRAGVQYSIDDAWDTMRSRGVAPTVRTTAAI